MGFVSARMDLQYPVKATGPSTGQKSWMAFIVFLQPPGSTTISMPLRATLAIARIIYLFQTLGG